MSTPFQDQLSAYLDGELDAAEAARLEAELRVNPTLRAELEALREWVAFVRSTGRIEAPPSFHGRVMARVAAEAAPAPWWAWLRRPLGVPIEGVAVALAAAAVLVVSMPEAPPEQPETSAAPVASVPAKASEPEDPAVGPPPEPVLGSRDREGDADAAARVGSAAQVASAGSNPRAARGAAASSGAAPVAPPPLAKDPGGPERAGIATAEEPALQGTSEALAPAIPPRHQVKVYAEGASVLAALQRTAARYRGEVRDSAGTVVRTGTQSADVATYRIRIPASALQDFYRDLQQMAVEVHAEDLRAGDFAETLEVEITVVLLGPARLGSESGEAQ